MTRIQPRRFVRQALGPDGRSGQADGIVLTADKTPTRAKHTGYDRTDKT